MKQLLIVILFLNLTVNYTANSKPTETNALGNAIAEISGDRIVLITGSTSGLGREVARSLVEQGAHVIIHGRNQERGQELLDELNGKRKNSARFYVADFGSLDAIRTFAKSINKDYKRLDVLINNAGIALIGQEERRISQDGYDCISR